MKAWLQRFMSGRYGNDPLNSFLCLCSLVFLVLGMFFSGLLYYVGIGLLVWAYFRMLSRNVQKRYAENLKFLSLKSSAAAWFSQRRVRFAQRGVYRYFRCPCCRQEIRIPKGRGRVSITCPKCKTQFIKKS